ncbi:aminoglycoside phosphotransferase family protein [Paenibacillus rhizovicinus]|uniref:Aminoglycoside phosphotransferase family protein n=1 Tax=Paenibacillus rhizovicinus TaxID=2704463 RepID=A0A6C0P395_9BACL|nr:phosphotransferase [Paenibacillus rhizovicinus]QHW32968.1 aminoglycoside phosphotransferase family protein [Paenibacillus rhizovicinus]
MKSMRFDSLTIQAIFDKHSLGRIDRIEYSDRGIVNPCVFINDNYVVRVNARDVELPKFDNEQQALQMMKSEGIPVPDVYVFDNSHDHLPYEILITSKMPGIDMWKALETADAESTIKLAYDSGVLLAKIHAIQQDKFGELALSSANRYGSWQEYLVTGMKQRTNRCLKLGIVTPEEAGRYVGVFERATRLFSGIAAASLVHNDYHFANVLCADGEITAILDMEWSIAGDPEFDFKSLNPKDVFADAWEMQQAFMAGYSTLRKLSPLFDTKQLYYQLFETVELISVAYLHWGEESYQRFKASAKSWLEQIEAAWSTGD